MKADASQPLQPTQKARLAILARMAFLLCKTRGAVDDGTDFDAWRKGQQGAAVGRESLGLREATQGDFRNLRGHWFVILGNAEAAFSDFMEGGAENEARRQQTHNLAAAVGSLAEFWRGEKKLDEPEAARQAWAYALAIAKDKAGGRRPAELSALELRQIAWTVLNRLSAKRGVGRPENRNKKQRQGACKPPASEPGDCPNRCPSAGFGR